MSGDSPRAHALPGSVLGGRYRLDDLLGIGSTGEVWRATDSQGWDAVAVKLMRAELAQDPSARASFRTEALAAAQIDHVGVVRVLDHGVQGGLPYHVMELCDGETLDQIILRGGAVGVGYATELAVQVLEALDAAHVLGVVHRDLKPQNVMIVHPAPHVARVKLLDFGVASGVHAALDGQLRGSVFGTPGYLAPEQISGATVDSRADLHAVGAILFELLTGAPPFGRGDETTLLARTLAEVPPRLDAVLPQVGAVLADWVAACLAKDPDERPSSALALARALEPFAPPKPRPALVSLDGDSVAPVPLIQRAKGAPPAAPRGGRLQLISASDVPPDEGGSGES